MSRDFYILFLLFLQWTKMYSFLRFPVLLLRTPYRFTYKNRAHIAFFKKKIDYVESADFIVAVMGDSNQCELLTLGCTPRVSLKLGRDWDVGSIRCPITATINKSARIHSNRFKHFSISLSERSLCDVPLFYVGWSRRGFSLVRCIL